MLRSKALSKQTDFCLFCVTKPLDLHTEQTKSKTKEVLLQ